MLCAGPNIMQQTLLAVIRSLMRKSDFSLPSCAVLRRKLCNQCRQQIVSHNIHRYHIHIIAALLDLTRSPISIEDFPSLWAKVLPLDTKMF
ncbi:hypothetical protein TNCV_3362951 [Trichonephila clavipes]|nr:hypothetical protein TNCV_3362951 [Trichonephila clavipes]